MVLLSSTADEGVWNYFATASIPDPAQVERLLAVLPGPGAEPASVSAVEAESGLRRTKVELMLKQLAVDGVTERLPGGWRLTGTPWIYDAAHYQAVIEVRRREADIMRAYARGDSCLMQLLQEVLDDPTAAPCGRCSVCAGVLPDGLGAAPDAEMTRAVAARLRAEQHRVEPRKMWPGGESGLRGRIPAGEAAEVGRALIFADAPEWRNLVQQVFGGADGPPPEELRQAVITLLASWRADWPVRPEVVIGLPAAGFPAMTTGLVAHIAEVGRMATAELAVTGPAEADLTSAAEAAHWARAIAMPGAAEVTGRVVLLVVDATSSLWPVTVACSKLRSAGAAAVLPLVIHRRP